MAYKRKIDLVETPEQFRNYIRSKNPRAKKMLEVYDDLMDGKKLDFGSGFTYAYLCENSEIPETSSIHPHNLILLASKQSGDYGKVEIDTGFIKITERGEVIPSPIAVNKNYSFDDWRKDGIEGLKSLKNELEKAISIYNKIFSRKDRND
ncbi:MAG: hypothetical protein ACOC5T_09700 [Elusimicrobiota bacterium]